MLMKLQDHLKHLMSSVYQVYYSALNDLGFSSFVAKNAVAAAVVCCLLYNLDTASTDADPIKRYYLPHSVVLVFDYTADGKW